MSEMVYIFSDNEKNLSQMHFRIHFLKNKIRPIGHLTETVNIFSDISKKFTSMSEKSPKKETQVICHSKKETKNLQVAAVPVSLR